MMDGIQAAVLSGKTSKEMEIEISKDAGVESFYLEKDRAYRSEMDVFEHYSAEERNRLFGTPPATVWENMRSLEVYPDKKQALLNNGVFTEEIIKSFKAASICKWETELHSKIIPENIEYVRECRRIHNGEYVTDIDVVIWEKINGIRLYLMKDSMSSKSLFTRIRESINEVDFETASSLQQEMNQKISEMRELYSSYKRNLFEAAE
jgi:glutamine synthetase